VSIPKHDQIRVTALSLLAERGRLKLREFEHFSLSDKVLEEYESGNGKIFYDRISWALSYINMAGLLSKPKHVIIDNLQHRLQSPLHFNQAASAIPGRIQTSILVSFRMSWQASMKALFHMPAKRYLSVDLFVAKKM